MDENETESGSFYAAEDAITKISDPSTTAPPSQNSGASFNNNSQNSGMNSTQRPQQAKSRSQAYPPRSTRSTASTTSKRNVNAERPRQQHTHSSDSRNTSANQRRGSIPYQEPVAAYRPQESYDAPTKSRSSFSSKLLIAFLVIIVLVLAVIFGYLFLNRYDMNALVTDGAQNAAQSSSSQASSAQAANSQSTTSPWERSGADLVAHYNSRAAVSLNAAQNGSSVSTDIGDNISIDVDTARNGNLQSVTVSAGLISLSNETTRTRMLQACTIIGTYLTPNANVSMDSLGIDTNNPSAILSGVDVKKSIEGTQYRVRNKGLSLVFTATKG